MKFKTWLLAAALALGLSARAFALEPIAYTAPDGVNAVAITQANPLPVGLSINAGATFNTPSGTSAYSSGQMIANSATAGSVVPMAFTVCRQTGGTGMVRKARISTADTGFAGVAVRLHLYRNLPTVANGDHASWSTTDSAWMEDIDVTLDHAFTDPFEKGIGTPNHGSEINFDCAAGTQTIFGLIEARGAITPQGAKALTVVLETLAN